MILLQGIVGSTAYGLAREGSDIDRLGVFAASTLDVAGLSWSRQDESKVSTDPDVTLHEVGKYLRLALKCNPSIMELLWLPPENLEIVEPVFGTWLIQLRQAFLSTGAIRSAYGGYARQQAARLEQRGDGSFSADTRKRTVKHARHLLRLLRQGREILATGQLTVAVSDPADYFAFDGMDTQQMLAVYEREDAMFTSQDSVLPARPDEDSVRWYLNTVRRNFMARALKAHGVLPARYR